MDYNASFKPHRSLRDTEKKPNGQYRHDLSEERVAAGFADGAKRVCTPTSGVCTGSWHAPTGIQSLESDLRGRHSRNGRMVVVVAMVVLSNRSKVMKFPGPCHVSVARMTLEFSLEALLRGNSNWPSGNGPFLFRLSAARRQATNGEPRDTKPYKTLCDSYSNLHCAYDVYVGSFASIE